MEGKNIKSIYNSIYKSPWDAFIYLILYIIIPVSQVIEYICVSDPGRFTCIVLLLLSILYDCYTRFNSDMSKAERRVIFAIGVVAVVLGIISIMLHSIVSSNKALPSWVYLLYIPIVYPLIVCVWELVEHVRRAMNI